MDGDALLILSIKFLPKTDWNYNKAAKAANLK